MAALEAALFLCPLYSSSSSSSNKLSSPKPLTNSVKFQAPNSSSFLPHHHHKSQLLSLHLRKPRFELCYSVQEIAVEEKPNETHVNVEKENQKRKLYVVNLPWSLTVVDIKSLFSQCGTVTDVEIIKDKKDGRNRGFAFVTMASGEEAQAVIDKFNLQEVSGRVIKIELAKRFKKPSPPPPPGPQRGETTHKLYVSNIDWKVRSTHLREFFSENFNPVSARVVFDSPKGRSAGYGFVSFATREEAEAAKSSLDGKELMGRPLRLKFSERNVKEKNANETENPKEEEVVSEGQTEES